MNIHSISYRTAVFNPDFLYHELDIKLYHDCCNIDRCQAFAISGTVLKHALYTSGACSSSPWAARLLRFIETESIS